MLKPEEIKEGNQLICDFMRWKLVKLNAGDTDMDDYPLFQFHRFNEIGEVIEIDCGGDLWSWDYGDEMHFESSWNKLMTVIEEIEKTPLVNASVDIAKAYIQISDKDVRVIVFQNTSNFSNKLEATFFAVTEFMRWNLKD